MNKSLIDFIDLARSVQSLADVVARVALREPELRIEAVSIRDYLWGIEKKLLGTPAAKRAWGRHLNALETVQKMRRTGKEVE